MARTVRDAALLLDVVAGADARDRLSWSSGVDYPAMTEGGVAGLRVAWSPNLGYARVDAGVAAATERAARRFVELGCEVEEVDPGLPTPWDLIDVMWSSAMAGAFHGRLEEVRDRLDPGLLGVVERGRERRAEELTAAQLRRNTYYHEMRQFMAGYDLLLTPAVPITAFTAGADRPEPMKPEHGAYLDWTPFTYPFNLTGQPAATVPCGFVEGLPVGLQIVGRWREDATVLRAAAAFEAIAPWADRQPKLS